MKIAGFEKLSLVDFDTYTACTLFTEGCNFRCPFCHNGPLVLSKDNPTVQEEEIFGYLKKRKGLIDGVCITGGEPTLHADLPEFIAKIKDLGYKVKLDSNGTNPEMLKKLIDNGLIDYVAMDIKSGKSGYKTVAGFSNDLLFCKVLQSIDLLKEGKIPFEFRTTLVNELHSFSDIEEIAELIKGCPKYFLQKFTDGENNISSGFTEVKKEKALEYKSFLEGFNINVSLRGYD